MAGVSTRVIDEVSRCCTPAPTLTNTRLVKGTRELQACRVKAGRQPLAKPRAQSLAEVGDTIRRNSKHCISRGRMLDAIVSHVACAHALVWYSQEKIKAEQGMPSSKYSPVTKDEYEERAMSVAQLLHRATLRVGTAAVAFLAQVAA